MKMLNLKVFFENLNREPFLKGKVQCSWPTYNKQFRSTSFDNENIIYFFHKTGYLKEKVNFNVPSLRLVFPGLDVPIQIKQIVNVRWKITQSAAKSG